MKNYKENNVTRSDLLIVYGQDFHNFTTETFEQAGRSTQVNLRKFLRKYGVYVNKTRGPQISETLVVAIKEELP